MKLIKPTLALACLMPGMLLAQEAQVTPLISKDLPDFPGKEGLMITVVYPPGASDPIHRHNADAFLYVLEGSVVMQVKGGKETTLTPGQTFYEGPDDVHIVAPDLPGFGQSDVPPRDEFSYTFGEWRKSSSDSPK